MQSSLSFAYLERGESWYGRGNWHCSASIGIYRLYFVPHSISIQALRIRIACIDTRATSNLLQHMQSSLSFAYLERGESWYGHGNWHCSASIGIYRLYFVPHSISIQALRIRIACIDTRATSNLLQHM